jgi:hypothetical protein
MVSCFDSHSLALWGVQLRKKWMDTQLHTLAQTPGCTALAAYQAAEPPFTGAEQLIIRTVLSVYADQVIAVKIGLWC